MEQSLLFAMFRHLIQSKAVTNLILFKKKKTIFFHACATCSELPSDMCSMVIPDSPGWITEQRVRKLVQGSDLSLISQPAHLKYKKNASRKSARYE